MELTNTFTVPVGVEQAWEVLSDLERIAPCMPGAQLTEVEGDQYRGTVKVKVGPITAQYKGTATVKEADAEAHRMVVDAGGRDTRGQGSADAVITVTMDGEGDHTTVDVLTELTIKGKVAQFGRGMLVDVSGKLLDQFVECLEGTLDVPTPSGPPTESPEAAPGEARGEALAEAPPAAPSTTTSGTPAVRKIDSPEAAPVDLLDAVGADAAKQYAPAAAAGFVVLFLLGWLRHRRRR